MVTRPVTRTRTTYSYQYDYSSKRSRSVPRTERYTAYESRNECRSEPVRRTRTEYVSKNECGFEPVTHLVTRYEFQLRSEYIPPRLESAARADDPRADAPLPQHVPHPHQTTTTMPPRSSAESREQRLTVLAEQILDELRRSKEQPVQDFSVTKMLAGITQVLTLAVLFMAYLNRDVPMHLLNTMVFALILQTMTIALLVMNRQR